jgi:hypothetical protein
MSHVLHPARHPHGHMFPLHVGSLSNRLQDWHLALYVAVFEDYKVVRRRKDVQ